MLAEAGPLLSTMIQKFRRAKAEQNIDSLGGVLGLATPDEVMIAIRQLVQIGFLEEVKNSWKVPMLYRDGLDVTQGKAFALGSDDAEDSEDA